VPSNTSIRDLDVEPPAGTGNRCPPKRPWQSVSKWAHAQADAAWTEIDVRDGSKGPLIVEALKRRVRTRNDKRQESPDDEMLVVIRYRDRDDQKVTKIDYYLSNASSETTLAEFASAAKAEHRIEECLRRAKSEAGLADYEVRNWRGWHHHQTLSLIATWFLVTESRRGKKIDPGDYGATNPTRHLQDPSPSISVRYAIQNETRMPTTSPTQRTRPRLSLENA
jgi:hypothetical protein